MNRYWKTPPDVMAAIQKEFGPCFDPCPFPRAQFNGLEIDWAQNNYVNPPFNRKDFGYGPTAFIKKAIQEQNKGKTSIIIIPTLSTVNMLLDAGAEARSMGRIKWLDCDTDKPWNMPAASTMFILKGK
jgi:hypothetical protein